ncbi:MAG: pentapeptide repeat-containing protein [Planctomycetes bacterium]|nr:pentapeptide repeat-containing protein [Planctomycetota bacterium]
MTGAESRPNQSQIRKRTRRAARTPDSQLAIRWFTPRGRAALTELLEDLLHGEGRHIADAVEDLRREGALPGRVDLRGIDLRGLELANAQLANADLRGARLAGTNLMRANLEGALLERAVLRGARLTGSSLRRANLERADLRDVDLSEANLEGANLSGAKMRGAELKRAWARGVKFEEAFVEGVDLTRVRRAPHRAPRSTARTRDGIGAPPGSEPVPATQRFRKRPRPPIPSPTEVQPGPSPSQPSFDAALADLLLNRADVDRIVVTMAGQELVLFVREDGRPALRIA